eukprot:COSAG06_NODE_57893_length_279_cov_0.422222_1_plen_59_part_01
MFVLFCTRGPARCAVFFNDTATTEIYAGEDTLSLHDALPHSLPSSNAMVIVSPPFDPSG